MNTCRFCKSWRREHQMVKYGVRHYAHFECYLDAGKQLSELQDWQVGQFPALLLKQRNLTDAAIEILKRDGRPPVAIEPEAV